MKLLIMLATLGLVTVFVLRRKRPELAERVEEAVREAAGHVGEDTPADLAARLRDKAKSVAG
jgi:hypothetical protein